MRVKLYIYWSMVENPGMLSRVVHRLCQFYGVGVRDCFENEQYFEKQNFASPHCSLGQGDLKKKGGGGGGWGRKGGMGQNKN